MELVNGVKAVAAKSRAEWRRWLEKNVEKEKSVWLILYNKNSSKSSVKIDEAVEEALCFGWIDSKAIKRDDESRYQSFSQRKPKSNWSKINRDRVSKLIKQGLMTSHGQSVIDHAKKTGTWLAMESVEKNIIPDDLQKLFNKNKTALKNFQAFAPSSKRMILQWILSAKRAETRTKRLEKTVELASKNIKANHPNQ